MIRKYILISTPVTGQTPLYSTMMQEWARQDYNEQSIECYCLDAPLYLPTGQIKTIGKNGGIGSDQFVNRETI